MLVASLALHQIKEVSTNSRETNPAECTTLAYIGITLTILSLILGHIPTLQKIKIV